MREISQDIELKQFMDAFMLGHNDMYDYHIHTDPTSPIIDAEIDEWACGDILAEDLELM